MSILLIDMSKGKFLCYLYHCNNILIEEFKRKRLQI